MLTNKQSVSHYSLQG